MRIFVNNKEKQTSAVSLQDLAQEMGLQEKGIAMALEMQLVRKELWAETPLREDAHVIIIKAACGG